MNILSPSRFILVSSAALAVGMIALPASAFAATYAYVNNSGEVSTVTADNANAALMTAPGIDSHSGVLLLASPDDALVGDHVNGV